MKPLNISKEALKEKLFQVVSKQEFHPHYQRTVDLAKFYKQVNTGDNQAELLVQYKPNETRAQKEQRIRIPNTRTPYLVNKLMSVYNELEQVDNVVDNLYFDNEGKDSTKKITRLKQRLDYFYHDTSLKNYLFETLKFLNFYDPNAFLVIEYERFQNDSYPWTYPLEVYAEQVMNFEYKHGVLQWLVARHTKEIVENEGTAHERVRDGYKYTIYGPQWSFVLEEVGSYDETPQGWERLQLEVENNREALDFVFQEFNTKNRTCPAVRVGYIMDPLTGRETCVSCHHPAEHIFRKLINEVAEDDLAMALHGFLQKFAYAPVCEWTNVETGDVCINGRLSQSNDVCPNCNGEGILVHKTVQDVILMKKPQDKEEHIPLSQMVHYVQIPTELVKMRKEEIAKLEKDVSLAIFNTNTFERSEVAVTATEKRLNLRNVYNVIGVYGENWIRIYKHCVRQTAQHLEALDSLVVEYGFPSDFRMDTMEELIQQRSMAVQAGSPYEIVNGIDMAILSKQFRDDAKYVEIVKARENFRPFREKTLNERMFVLSQLPEDNYFRILYSYFIEIMTEVEDEHPKFYEFKPDRQRGILEDKVDSWKERYGIEQPTAVAQSFRGTAADQQEEVQNEPETES